MRHLKRLARTHAAVQGTFTPLRPNLFRIDDTCNVYLIKDRRRAILIDFGAGGALDALPSLGIASVGAVLITHHHRAQVQALARAVEHGAEVWVPPIERDLFDGVDKHWQTRALDISNDVRDDRFSLLEPVRITGVVPEYRPMHFGSRIITPIPTPGHTVGSVSYLLKINRELIAFTGDLIWGRGKVWSLASTQWTYGGVEGVAATILSLLKLRDLRPDILLPSHGDPIDRPADAIEETVARLTSLLEFRNSHPRLLQ